MNDFVKVERKCVFDVDYAIKLADLKNIEDAVNYYVVDLIDDNRAKVVIINDGEEIGCVYE